MNVNWDLSTNGSRLFEILLNGNVQLDRLGEMRAIDTTAIPHWQTFTGKVLMGSGDYLELQVWQNSGANLNVLSANTILNLYAIR